jgi:uncharacterized membrane protein HdeD (DUF308 family)
MSQTGIRWWALLFRGLAGVFLGGISLFLPTVTLTALVFVFAVYCGTDGVFNLFAAWEHRSWWNLGQGLFGITAALVTFTWPDVTAVVLLYLLAAWSLCAGAFELFAAVRLRRAMHREWVLAVLGVLSILFAVLLLLAPLTGALVLAVWFGAYASAYGVFLLVAAYRMRRWEVGGSSHGTFRHA